MPIHIYIIYIYVHIYIYIHAHTIIYMNHIETQLGNKCYLLVTLSAYSMHIYVYIYI